MIQLDLCRKISGLYNNHVVKGGTLSRCTINSHYDYPLFTIRRGRHDVVGVNRHYGSILTKYMCVSLIMETKIQFRMNYITIFFVL